MSARLSRRALLRHGAVAASAAAAAPLLGTRPVFGATPANAVAADNLAFARVWPRTARELAGMSWFDDTHAIHADGSMEILLWPGHRRRLDALGVRYELFTPQGTGAVPARNRAGGVPLQPGERTAYRRLGDYVTDLQALATAHPEQAAVFTFPEKSLEGRTVYGIEIADDVAAARTDGRPVFWIDGIHHSREWPSSELSIMFAFDLLENFGKDDQVTSLLQRLRVIVVPVMNPDGFHRSREAPTDTDPASLAAYWRKNTRSFTGLLYSLGGTNSYLNADAHGTDPNRNYPFFWGGEGGGTTDPTSQTYGGSAPFAEPEARNIAGVMKANQVTAYLTNHTHGRLCMRPWGWTPDPSPDNDFQEELGFRMCEHHGYRNQIGLSLYPTAGTSRDWSYAALRTIVYTFEHCTAFHPAYGSNVPGYYGINRPAWMLLAEAAADPANHLVIKGRAVDAAGAPVAGAEVRLSKQFNTPTAAEVQANEPNKGVAESISTTALTAADGTFEVHANPSTRPFTIMVGGDEEAWTVDVLTEDVEGTLSAPTRQVVGDRGDVRDLGDLVLG